MLIVLQQEKENKFTKELFDVVNVFHFVRANLFFYYFFFVSTIEGVQTQLLK
jgi:hypothetical protein